MDAGGRTPKVGALGDAGAIAEATQKKVTRPRVRQIGRIADLHDIVACQGEKQGGFS
jgi:hypothetical protein